MLISICSHHIPVTNVSETTRITIRVPQDLADAIDVAISNDSDYASRSDFLETAIRFGLEWCTTTIINEKRDRPENPKYVWYGDNLHKQIYHLMDEYSAYGGEQIRLTLVLPSGIATLLEQITKALRDDIGFQNLIRAFLMKYLNYYETFWKPMRDFFTNPNMEYQHGSISGNKPI